MLDRSAFNRSVGTRVGWESVCPDRNLGRQNTELGNKEHQGCSGNDLRQVSRKGEVVSSMD